MPVALGNGAFTAFQNHLRTLCLNEFPCGSGPWRTSTKKKVNETRFAVTLKDYGAENEQEETLEELVTSKFSPYSVDYSWSDEAKELREVAVKSPWLITEEFIHKHFKTLRIVDKNISQLDADLLKLSHLEELTVSANHLTTVDSQNIPKTVKVLELVANEINDLEQLCADPPPQLQHLGLGMNKISAIHDYITGAHWPCLLSLDLSHNNLCDLIDIINKLSSLPRLRNLVLLGNPLALIPGYRGFTVDSLRNLSILDDLQISADEEHHYKGLAKRKEYVLDEAKVTVTISAASGIPHPIEHLTAVEVPQYPITTRTYYVEYMFLQDFKVKKETDNASKVSGESQKREDKVLDTEKDVVATGDAGPGSDKAMDGANKEQSEESDSTIFTPSDSPSLHPSKPQDPGYTTSSPSPPILKLIPYRTQGLRWTDESFEFKYSQELVIDDLPALKEYFKGGMHLTIKEDKVISTPALPEESSEDGKDGFKTSSKNDAKTKMESVDSVSRLSNNSSRLGKMKSRMGGAGRLKSMGSRAQSRLNKGGRLGAASSMRSGTSMRRNASELPSLLDKKKKKKEPEIELIHSPPEVTTLGTYTLELADFIEGEYLVKDTCICERQGGNNEEEDTVKEEDVADAKKDKKKKERGESPKSKKGKPDAKESKEGKDKDKGKKHPQKPDKKESKAKRPSSSRSQHSEEEEEKLPPPPLTVSISVKLHQWKTAQESLPKKTVTEKKAQVQETIME